MTRNLLTFINHACFEIRTDNALLLADPWVEGTAFNHGWSLLDRSTSNAALIARLNEAALPVYIWYSHEHPDHFSISFLKKFKEDFRGTVTFLFQETLDKRVLGFLRHNGFQARECRTGVPMPLGPDTRIVVFPFSDGDSFCLIEAAGKTVLNLNDCVINTRAQCDRVKAALDRFAPRIDVLFTQFGYANWVGNPDEPARHRSAALEKIERIALQIDTFAPALVVPFASFVYFSTPENAYLNEAQNTPHAVVAARRLAPAAHLLRFLRPGDTVDLAADTPESLGACHERALAHWSGMAAAGLPLLPAQPPASLAEVHAAFSKYREAMNMNLHNLPRLLERMGRITPLTLHLSDLQATLRCSYRDGITALASDAAYDVAMTSANAIFLFKNEYGFDTTQVNGRFRVARTEASGVFSRFFLPQRMGKNGFDRRHPLLTLRYLVGKAFGQVGRRMPAS
jgi:glyoxylase-like metal-dependent hydrolase (beta-lactamase superfamily II)